MNQIKEALDDLIFYANSDRDFIDDEQISTVSNASKALKEFIANHELELAKLNATIQNKNAVINILEKRLNKIPPKDFEEAMKFHRMALQEHLVAIDNLQAHSK